ncbi:hypothetical protein EVAR_92091_1 [Eumeta japonica]|uniref:Uncharacterized protein n=1 Tax=Eumeta variegata TaxID=151549 RepID=A0A4C1SYB7_EUMVA|nr:hypothetical protein EVAR_92091_1 [Eumeta japonica]
MAAGSAATCRSHGSLGRGLSPNVPEELDVILFLQRQLSERESEDPRTADETIRRWRPSSRFMSVPDATANSK